MERSTKPVSSPTVQLPKRSRYGSSVPKVTPQHRTQQLSSVFEERKVTVTFRQRVRTGLTPRVEPKRTIGTPILKSEVPGNKDRSRMGKTMGFDDSRRMKETQGREKVASRIRGPIVKLPENDVPKGYILIHQNQSKTRTDKSPSLVQKEERRLFESVPDFAPKPRFAANNRRDEMISVKEAVRDREWLAKCKDMILGDFHSHILRSFGISLDHPNSTPQSGYRIYIGPGNNSQLVKKAFAKRWWWTRLEEPDKASANLLWTQWKDKSWVLSMSRAQSAFGKRAGIATETNIECPLRYNPTNGPYQMALTGRLVDLTPLSYELILKSPSFARAEVTYRMRPGTIKTHNKLEGNQNLANKKALFVNMRAYYECMGADPFQVIPLTFHIKDGEIDPEFRRFEEVYYTLTQANEQIEDLTKRSKLTWILKPGENTNRGTGIVLCATLDSIKAEMRSSPYAKPGVRRTFILQRYLDKPFLIHRRKFDIRLYAMLVCANGVLQAYYYSEGYIRTSSKEFSMNNISNKMIHLTNDAVQKFSEDYGKFEMANKLSYGDLQRYLDTHCRDKGVNFNLEVIPKMKAIVKDTVQSVYLKIDPYHRSYSFEVLSIQIFGYDFMLDESLKPWLIEVNTNPCLELSSPLLARIIPSMLENALRYCSCSIAVDPFFPEPPSRKGANMDALAENKFELIFHELVDGPKLKAALGSKMQELARDFPELKDLDEEADAVCAREENEEGC